MEEKIEVVNILLKYFFHLWGDEREIDEQMRAVLVFPKTLCNMAFADPACAFEVTDDETMLTSSQELLFAFTEGAIKAVAATNRTVVLTGFAPSPSSLERAIRALDNAGLANIPVIAMTASALSADVQAAFDAGMNAHISKPIDLKKMMATLAELLSASGAIGERTE